MGILDYIFKSKEQREKDAQAAEDAKNAALLQEVYRTYKAKDYNACLKASLVLVNKNFFGVGFWEPYIRAAEILLKKGRYEDVLALKSHYHYFADRDKDRTFDWYLSRAKELIEEKKNPKPASKTVQKPSLAQEQPKPVAKPILKPVAVEQPQPKPQVHVPKWDDDEPEKAKETRPGLRPLKPIEKSETLYWRYRKAKNLLPPFDLLGASNTLPENAVKTIKAIKAEAQKLLDQADAYYQKKDFRAAAILYENLIKNKYWEPEPYVALIDIYERHGRHRDAQEVRQEGIMNLSLVQHRMENELLDAAKNIDAEDLALDMIKNGEKVVYGMGLHTVYDPFPCIGQWRKEMVVND